MRIVLIEAGHWHCPLYLPALHEPGLEVVAVSDPSPDAGARVAAEFGCPVFADYRDLLRENPADFAFAFGRHDRMPEIAEALIARAIPFNIEKPCGIALADVARLRDLAEATDLFVSIPFIYRHAPLRAAIESREQGCSVAHLSIRNIAGPPERYTQMGVPWMLDPAASGGGCVINLGVHFVDLAQLLTGSKVTSVFSRMSARPGLAVEDYGVMMLGHDSGAVSTIEVGYTHPAGPEKREFSLSYSSRGGYCRTTDAGLRYSRDPSRGEPAIEDIAIEPDTDTFYPPFVSATLDRFRSGGDPIAGLADMESVMSVIQAAYDSARSGEPATPQRRGLGS